MKISPTKFYRLALLIPYVMLLVFLPFSYLGAKSVSVEPGDPVNSPVGVAGTILGFFAGVLAIVGFVYTAGAVYWLIPYTLLAAALWRWSLRKTKSQIYKMFIWSPFFLALLTTAFYMFVSYSKWFGYLHFLGDDILSTSSMCIFPASIVFGYLFIGVTAWLYDFLLRTGRMIDDEVSLNLEM